MGTGENIRRVENLVANSTKQCCVVVVVSALDGTTDDLLETAEQAKKGSEAHLRKFKQKMHEKR